MKINIIRSPVHIIANSENGVYEATEDPQQFTVNVCQMECWWGTGGELHDLVRKVPIRVTEQVYKIGMELPGSICIALTTEQINPEDNQDHLWLDQHGQVQYTEDGQAIYGYWYYDKQLTYIPTDRCVYDDTIEMFNSKMNK